MKKSKMIMIIVGFIYIFFIISLFQLPAKQARAEKLVESSLFFRMYVVFSVDQKALQDWIPDPWKAVSLPKGPFKGANLFVIFDDRFISQDAEGKPYKGGAFHNAVLAAYAKNLQTKELAVFVIRVCWPHDDPGAYKNAVKATVHRETSLKGENLIPGTSSEVWKVQDSSGGILEFRLDYQRAVSKRTKREFKARSNVKPDFFRIYRDDYAGDLVKSVSVGIDRVQKYQFRSTISELGKMFDGSEQLVAILVNPCRVRQVFLP